MSPRILPPEDLQPSAAADLPRRANPSAGMALRYRITEQSDRVTRLAWSPDGALLAVPSRDGVLRVHDARTGELRLTLLGHASAVMGVAWSPGGSALASIGGDDRVRIWDAARGDMRQVLECPEGSLTGIAWCPRPGMLAATSESGRVLRWRQAILQPLGAGSLTREEPLPSPGALHVAWAPDGSRIAVGARDGSVRLWDPWSGALLAELAGHADAAVIAAWAPDGSIFATGSKDGTIRLWDATDPRPPGTLDAHRDQVMAIAFSPDGRLLASKSRDGTVLVWRPDPWRVVAAISERSAEIGWSVGLAFHPREAWLATLGLGDRGVRVWQVDGAGLPTAALARREIDAVARPWPDFSVERRRRVMLR